MKRRFSRKPPPPCAELGPDDGIDPGTLRPADRHRVTNRKALQLCEQIAHTLGSVFAGECADDLLRDAETFLSLAETALGVEVQSPLPLRPAG